MLTSLSTSTISTLISHCLQHASGTEPSPTPLNQTKTNHKRPFPVGLISDCHHNLNCKRSKPGLTNWSSSQQKLDDILMRIASDDNFTNENHDESSSQPRGPGYCLSDEPGREALNTNGDSSPIQRDSGTESPIGRNTLALAVSQEELSCLQAQVADISLHLRRLEVCACTPAATQYTPCTQTLSPPTPATHVSPLVS